MIKAIDFTLAKQNLVVLGEFNVGDIPTTDATSNILSKNQSFLSYFFRSSFNPEIISESFQKFIAGVKIIKQQKNNKKLITKESRIKENHKIAIKALKGLKNLSTTYRQEPNIYSKINAIFDNYSPILGFIEKKTDTSSIDEIPPLIILENMETFGTIRKGDSIHMGPDHQTVLRIKRDVFSNPINSLNESIDFEVVNNIFEEFFLIYQQSYYELFTKALENKEFLNGQCYTLEHFHNDTTLIAKKACKGLKNLKKTYKSKGEFHKVDQLDRLFQKYKQYHSINTHMTQKEIKEALQQSISYAKSIETEMINHLTNYSLDDILIIEEQRLLLEEYLKSDLIHQFPIKILKKIFSSLQDLKCDKQKTDHSDSSTLKQNKIYIKVALQHLKTLPPQLEQEIFENCLEHFFSLFHIIFHKAYKHALDYELFKKGEVNDLIYLGNEGYKLLQSIYELLQKSESHLLIPDKYLHEYQNNPYITKEDKERESDQSQERFLDELDEDIDEIVKNLS